MRSTYMATLNHKRLSPSRQNHQITWLHQTCQKQGCANIISRLGAESHATAVLARFQAKACPGLDPGWTPVRVKKTRQIKNPEPRFDSIETEKARLGWVGAPFGPWDPCGKNPATIPQSCHRDHRPDQGREGNPVAVAGHPLPNRRLMSSDRRQPISRSRPGAYVL